MSTRGCVAIANGDGFRGVYNHFDSYPSGLGKELWDHLQGKDLEQFAKELLQYGDWREYLNGGVCEYCGKKAGQPHSISGVIFALPGHEPVPEIQRNLSRTGYPDPEAKHHEHVSAGDSQMTDQDADPLFIEWVYVLAPKNGCVTVFAHATTKELREGQHGTWCKPWTLEELDGSLTEFPGQYYIHEPVAQFSLSNAEPDWDRIQCGEDLERCVHVEGYHQSKARQQ